MVRQHSGFAYTPITTFGNDDLTPTVRDGCVFKTATGHGAARNITMFNNGIEGQQTRYVILEEIEQIDKTALIDFKKENFQNYYQLQNTSKYPKNIFVKMYFLSISVLLMYIFLKILKKS